MAEKNNNNQTIEQFVKQKAKCSKTLFSCNKFMWSNFFYRIKIQLEMAEKKRNQPNRSSLGELSKNKCYKLWRGEGVSAKIKIVYISNVE